MVNMKAVTAKIEEFFNTIKGKLLEKNPNVLFLETWNLPGQMNMDIDERLMGSELSVFRLYTWLRPTLSLGRLQKPERLKDLLKRAKSLGVDVVVRPTGGRAVLHYKELTYSFVGYRNGLTVPEIHLFFNFLFMKVINLPDISLELTPDKITDHPNCFLQKALYELNYKGKKVMGSAIRLKGNRFLIHGSLLLERDKLWEDVFQVDTTDFIGLKEIKRDITIEELSSKLQEELSSQGFKVDVTELEALEGLLGS